MEKRDNTDRRPSPDALLREAQQAEQGRLKIFLGAAPGVGKTYEMLTTARAKKAEGVDVVIGVVETHGRKETEALLQGLEIIPRRIVPYKGHRLAEMDIDAILTPQARPRSGRRACPYQCAGEPASQALHGCRGAARRRDRRLYDPQHPACRKPERHRRRNHQIRVRETVPDSIIDLACDIELIDLTPEDLIARLNEGKVYVPEQAERATRNYFSPGNLTALRELALRRTAQRVDAQMVDYMRAHRIEGSWSASERVLVLVDSARRAPMRSYVMPNAWPIACARSGRRSMSKRRPTHTRARPSAIRSRRALRLAQRLGAATISIPGEDVASTVAEYARGQSFCSYHRRQIRAPALAGFLQGIVCTRS